MCHLMQTFAVLRNWMDKAAFRILFFLTLTPEIMTFNALTIFLCTVFKRRS